jgi:2,3-dihydroxyphenylpropionate 1,2-dioxygenase
MTERKGIVAGAAVPHAPQFHSLPSTEDRDQVGRVREAMQKVGDGLRALKPDVVIVMTNDHGDEYIVGCVPPFVVHCGNRAQGMHKHRGWWNLKGDIGYDIVRGLMRDGFDPAFTLDAPLATPFTIPLEFMGFPREAPFLPIFINSYVPPQPSAERCYRFGQALNDSVVRLGLRAVFIASGGLSHYPGTPQYSHPDLGTDKLIYERLSQGNLRHLLSYSDEALDRSGNVESRSIIALAGALGERKPDITAWEPSWHHTYAVFGWTSDTPAEAAAPHYPATPPEHAQLARALFELRTSDDACRRFLADRAGFAQSHALSPEQTEALVAMDESRLRDGFRQHPLLPSGAARRLSMVSNAANTAAG